MQLIDFFNDYNGFFCLTHFIVSELFLVFEVFFELSVQFLCLCLPALLRSLY